MPTAIRVHGLEAMDSVSHFSRDVGSPEWWQAARAQGTPLMVRDQNEWKVTFLWRSQARLENVVVISDAVGWNHSENCMERLPGTDVWFATYRMPRETRVTYQIATNDSLITPRQESRSPAQENWHLDPLNAKPVFWPKNPDNPGGKDRHFSVLETPDAPAQLLTAPRSNRQGEVEQIRFTSKVLNNDRNVWLYKPYGYEKRADLPLLICLDGFAYTHYAPLPAILDNLIADGFIPPTVAVLPDSLDATTRGRELCCNQPFVEFLAHELLPDAWRRFERVSRDPADTFLMGSSYGGLASVFTALRRPLDFGNAISLSGSFWWGKEANDEGQWLTGHIPETHWMDPFKPKFYLTSGEFEDFGDYGEQSSILRCSAGVADELDRKGYAVSNHTFHGGHDYEGWKAEIATALPQMMGPGIAPPALE